MLCAATVICLTGCAKGGTSAETSAVTTPADAVTSAETAADTDTSALTGLWADADYTTDTELGSGKTTVKVAVTAEERTVTFTLHTDKTTLGDALLEHGLIAGEQGAYGMYIKTVNGMFADYDTDQTYWSLCKDGEFLSTGVDATAISDGDSFELIRVK